MNLGLLVLFLSFRAGYLPEGNLNYGITETKFEYFSLDESYYIQFEVDFRIAQFIFIRGSLNNIFNMAKESMAFSPDHDEYIIAAGLVFDNLEIGYKHKCYHPLFPYLQSDSNIMPLIEGAFDEFYIKFNSRIDIL